MMSGIGWAWRKGELGGEDEKGIVGVWAREGGSEVFELWEIGLVVLEARWRRCEEVGVGHAVENGKHDEVYTTV